MTNYNKIKKKITVIVYQKAFIPDFQLQNNIYGFYKKHTKMQLFCTKNTCLSAAIKDFFYKQIRLRFSVPNSINTHFRVKTPQRTRIVKLSHS